MQAIQANKLKKKIYLYDEEVQELKNEFKQRLTKKRNIIEKMRHLCKEFSLKDATLLCSRCNSEVSILKSLSYISPDKHHARCSFGFLKRIEVEEATNNANGLYSDPDNQGFIELYRDIFKEWESDKGELETNNKKNKRFAFCECKNHHIVGYVDDQRFYLTDISPLMIMFPQGNYEEWTSKWWSPGYKEAIEQQNIYNAQYANRLARQKIRTDKKILCELCNETFFDQQDFVVHCMKDKNHKDLISQFMDETYDKMFEKFE